MRHEGEAPGGLWQISHDVGYRNWKSRRIVADAIASNMVPRQVYLDEIRVYVYEDDDEGLTRVAPWTDQTPE